MCKQAPSLVLDETYTGDGFTDDANPDNSCAAL